MDQLRAVVYRRISQDQEGLEHGVERQAEDCAGLADREGCSVVKVYTDNDLGAWRTIQRRRADGSWEIVMTPRRPGFEEMIDAADRGEFDVILSYSNSRLTRRPLELERLIQLHDRTGVKIHTVSSGSDDLSTADGRMTARIKAAVDAAEAERQSERTKRALKQRRDAGLRTGGRAPYGYRNSETDKGRLEIDAERASVVREAATRLLAGETVYGVYSDLNRRDVRTGPSQRAPEGSRWEPRTLKRIMTNPALIGCTRTDDGALREVAEPILSRADWERLGEILHKRTGTTDWTNRRRYVLSGLMVCGLCGHKMSGSTRRKYGTTDKIQTFQCTSGNGGCDKIRIDYAPVEAWVLGMVFARLDVPAVAEALTQPAHEPHEADALREQIATDERALTALEDEYDDGGLDRARYLRRSARLKERLDTARAALADTAPAFTIDTGGKSLRQVWEANDDDTWRRTFLEQVLHRVVIGAHPTGAGVTAHKRTGESDEELAQRRRDLLDDLLSQRVDVSWRA